MIKKILVVDDEETIRKFVKIHLVKDGYEVKARAESASILRSFRR